MFDLGVGYQYNGCIILLVARAIWKSTKLFLTLWVKFKQKVFHLQNNVFVIVVP